jgi:hypothetical protein
MLVPNWFARLYVNNVTPSPTSQLTDFQQAVFAGYADAQINPGMTTPTGQGGMQALTFSGVISWQMGSPATSVTVYGVVIYFQDGSGNTYFGAELFSTPVTLSAVGNTINLQIGAVATSAA